MTSIIHILDPHSANQIAAGEVVERPASVVKELVENALDSGARHIDISVDGNGIPFIRVRDDGRGMSSADLPLAVIQHATSKIRRIEDLDQLQTLGFRGEALPSIASVSQMEISSRPVEEMIGLSLKLDGGAQISIEEVGCPVGTSVTVRNLFFNTPARLKFLKSTQTEFGLISDTIGRIALAHPAIAFSLSHPQQVVLQTSGHGDLRETIGAILGHATARQLIPIHAQYEDWQLEGFISPPDLVRSSKQGLNFMINGRMVRSPFLSRALEEGYHTLIPVKLHPIAVLHLRVSPTDYDVNVHPTKMDVRFKNEKALASFISQAVRHALIQSKPLPTFQSKPSPSSMTKSAFSERELPYHSLSSHLAPDDLKEQERSLSAKRGSPSTHFNDLEAIINVDTGSKRREQAAFVMSETSRQGLGDNLSKEDEHSVADVQSTTNIQHTADEQSSIDPLPIENIQPLLDNPSSVNNVLDEVWPLAQLFNTYILATDGQFLILIDQHAAHERINYERLLAAFKQAEHHSQALLIPLPMEFTLQEEQAILEYLWILSEMGFVLEHFGERTYLLRGVPAQTGTLQADAVLRQFIEEVLQKNTAPDFDKLVEEWIYLLACKESIKAKETLSLLEMEQLMSRLGQTQNPYTCPHGRPTMIKMSRSELERRFYRT